MGYMKLVIKVFFIFLLIWGGIHIGSYGFTMPNKSAADICFGLALTCFTAVLYLICI